jgi:Flp pilus assembly protein TadD
VDERVIPAVSMKRTKDPIGLSDEHNSRGIELADRGWLDEAINEFNRAIELDPHSAHAHDNLATVYAEKKLYREALREYLLALSLEPDSATAHYNLACFLSASSHDMAIDEYRHAIDLEPDYPDAHLNLGLGYADEGRFEDAMKELEIAIRLAPDDPLPRHEIAALLMDEGDYRSAISHLKEVTKLDAESFDAYLDLGICYAQKGFYAEAERAYQRARELNGDDLLLDYNLAALYALWSRPTDALPLLGRAVEKDGAKVRSWLQSDPMFESMRGTPEFEGLLG